MDREQEQLIRTLADKGETGSPATNRMATAALAQVVLEIASAPLRLAASATGLIEEMRKNQPRFVTLDAPITADELLRRGTDDDLHIRAIDIIYRCGFPRPDAPLGVECVPVPVETMRRIRAFLDHRDSASADACEAVTASIDRLLADHDTIRTAYTTAKEAGLIPELRSEERADG